ncbi:FtsW/RodA/SpoVE family cell cycle protein [Anaerobutyricum hallii]|uniref:FtsW/RodA/SpoVE family cell cycle protein n=1 Tax=Anaerobutyricum hallii TaxID=39488 RepID=UPI0026729FF9|nr:FtsW/RodA/SpoVE family cell cycle protein [Anaerobutyricum hallii]
MSRHDTGTKAFSFERVVWEIQRAFYSFKNSPVLALLLMQAAAFIFVQAKGAGKIYLDMIGILLAITLLSWFFTSVIHGNKKIVIYTLLLLTVGTMLQCIFKEEQVLKNPQYYATHNPATSLQFQYILGFVMALLAAFIYINSRNIASIKCLKRFKLSTIKVCRIFFWFSLLLSAATLVLAKSVGNVRNWITIGGISLQTTEFIKFLYVFIAAGLLGTKANPDKENIRAFYTVTFLEVLFLALQSEFGTMLLILMLFLTFLFLFVPDIKVFIGTVFVMVAGSVGLSVIGAQITKWNSAGVFLGTNKLAQIFLSNYNKIANRFIYWLHPEKDALGLGYQLLKAKESIVLGGWFGTSSVTELPVKTSDLVYPALIQRCGMIFALLVFIVFIMMWLEGVRLFVRKQDRYHRAVGAGFVFMLFDQTLIIIAGSTGLCPLTGITLPFISSGGTSLMISFMIVGLIVAVSSNVKWKGTVEDEEEQDKFFKENAVTAKCHAYLRHLNDHFSRESFRAASGRIKRSGQKEESGQGKDI